jgi:FSR family fosmidomycin resistance protein-like MFS transporter
LVFLTLAIVAGKGLGGYLGDKFGWLKIGTGSLLLLIVFLFFGTGAPYLAMVGMFLFNFTMPIVLTSVANILTGRPGVAFGLNCLVLLLGVLPKFMELVSINQIGFGFLIGFSALVFYFGMIFYQKANKTVGILTS